MKRNICTINMNEGEGRQTIYWDSEDMRLHTYADPDADTEYRCETYEQAVDTANALWGRVPGWDLEWIEDEDA